MGVEGFDGKLDNGGVSGRGDVDATGCEDGTVVLVDEADFGADIPVGHAVAEARKVNGGEAVLVGAAREINQMIGRLQKFFDDRQIKSHEVLATY